MYHSMRDCGDAATQRERAGEAFFAHGVRALYGERAVWARPLPMWRETVTVPQPWPTGEALTRPRVVLEAAGSAWAAASRDDGGSCEAEEAEDCGAALVVALLRGGATPGALEGRGRSALCVLCDATPRGSAKGSAKGLQQHCGATPLSSGGLRAAAALLHAQHRGVPRGAVLVPGDARALAVRRRLWAILELFDAATSQVAQQQAHKVEQGGSSSSSSSSSSSKADDTRAAQPLDFRLSA